MGGLFHQRNLKQFRLNVLTTFLETNFINPCRKRTWVYKDASRHFFQLHNEEKGREGPFSDLSSIRELRSKWPSFLLFFTLLSSPLLPVRVHPPLHIKALIMASSTILNHYIKTPSISTRLCPSALIIIVHRAAPLLVPLPKSRDPGRLV